jgi:hypothetical protein
MLWSGMSVVRLSAAARATVALAALVPTACDPYIFTISNDTDQTVTAVVIYEERTQDRGMRELRPGEVRRVDAVEFRDSRFVRVEAYDANAHMIYCQRFSRPQYEQHATYPAEAPLIRDVAIRAGEIGCGQFRPFQTPTPRPATPCPTTSN